MDMIQKTATAKVDDSLTYVMSDGAVDRMGDVIEPDGWLLDNFRRNPIALFGHSGGFPIGSWRDVRVEKGELKGRLELLPKGTSSRLDEIRAAVDAGVLRAVSVGFRARKTEPLNKEGGIRFLESELLECSLVSIPANPNALQTMKGLGLSRDGLATVFGEHADTAPAPVTRAIGEHAAAATRQPAPPVARATPMNLNLSQRVEAAQAHVVALRDQFNDHLAALGDVPSEAELAKTDELNSALASAQRVHDSLLQAEQTLGRQGNGGANLPAIIPQPVASPMVQRRPLAQPLKIRDGEHYFRAMIATCKAAARGWRPGLDSPEPFFQALAEAYPDGFDDRTKALGLTCYRGNAEACLPIETFQRVMGSTMITRAATAPATTTQSGWASQLVNTGYGDFLDLLLPASVFPGLAARAMRLTFGRNGIISIPSRVSTPTIAGAFVAEGAAIPVKQGAVTSQTFTPKKMGVISGFTREIAEHSTPAIESLIRTWMQEDTSVSLDGILLDANPATTTRPAGIKNGVAAITATTGGGFNALVGDLKALVGALLTATNNNLRRPVWLMNPAQQLSISLTQNAGGDFPFKAEISGGNFMGYPVIVSGNVTAGQVILLDAADFAVIEAGAPRFDVSDQATLHFEDTAPAQIGTVGSPNVVAAPTRSLWQTDSMAIRMILDVNWGFVRTGSIAWTQGVTW